MSGYQVMPRLSADEYADLESDIVAHGVMVPITVSADGVIVDGHHRDEIARKHDLHCPRVTADGSESELRGLAFSLNLNRRHLNREQRRELIAESLRSDPQLSNREHARRTGASDKTVGSVRDDLVESAEIPHFSERIDPRTGNLSQAAERHRATSIPQSDLDALNAATEDQDDDPEPPHWEPAGQMSPAATQALTPEKPKRTPITDDANRIGWEIRKTTEKLDRLTEDDRWTRNTEKVTPLLRGHLQEAISTYTRILAELEGK
ncbi:MAG: ParB/RepB/Spo0J family partition protein [Acidipropionibacterium jensenii]|uniref:ParB/RepB/Spo0J family partition protein n=1 Tax=Acidipropionibacterium jensenii TaxID=1749 RepID=UPI002648462C|nr:ParB/RepB/Spo0J family partition protein [Acidipropionibacterium jensenii]MDN6440466.1 ParB/RepB/Spo0J family partition protein [Acidipropionibacterium jensenii]